MKSLQLAALVALVCLVPPSAGADDKKVSIGTVIPKLTFKDIRYLTRTLDDFPQAKTFVVVFTNTSCPLVQKYLPTLKKLEQEYRTKAVQFLAVNVGLDDSILTMAAQSVRHDIAFPFVKDFEHAWVKALGVRRTPEAVVLDEKRRMRYRGRIDDQYRLGGVRQEPSSHELKDAIEAVIAGREVAVAETPVDGCAITPLEQRGQQPAVTYAEHVAPILKKHCQECHRPGAAAPFSLVSYKQAVARSAAIAEVVAEERMPPWYGAPEFGPFLNRRGMSAAERDVVLRWILNGKDPGDVSKLPDESAAEKAKPWRIGDPDQTLHLPEHELPPSGDIPYKYAFLPYVFLEDTWVQGVEIKPDNPRVLHHCNMAHGTLTGGFKAANFITGIVPGGEAMLLDEGIGFLIPKGSMLALQIHYVSTGKPEKCRVSVGLKFPRGIVQKQLRHYLLVNNRFAIPPESPAHPVRASKTLDREAFGVGLFTHMHLRGKDMTFTAHYPDGRTETLLIIPNYNFNWQMPYHWVAGAKRFPKGTRFECMAHFDNSSFNPYNPDAKATVRDGPQTHHEMMNGFVFFTDANEQLNLAVDAKTGRQLLQYKKP